MFKKLKKSKETYGQTRGLSNPEMKHVGKLAIIGALLKSVKTSCVRTRESTKHGPLVHGPPPWTGSMKIWTGSMDPLFLLPLKLIRSKIK